MFNVACIPHVRDSHFHQLTLICSHVYISSCSVDSLRFSEGESFTLNTGVPELQTDDQVLWRFGSEDAIIAKRDRNTNQISYNDADDERFRGRLNMDKTGSLSVTNTKSTDSGFYHLQISSRNDISYRKFRVTVWCE